MDDNGNVLSRAIFDYDPVPALQRYRGPKLVVIIPGNNQPCRLHKLAPGMDYRIVAGTSHWLHMDEPEEFYASSMGFSQIPSGAMNDDKEHGDGEEEGGKMKILVGTSGYGYKEWKGVFYPEKMKDREMLGFYAQRFGTVEINYTFYHLPTEKLLSSWAEQVPDDFAIAFKAPQVITHRKRLHNVDGECDYFFRTLAVLGRKTGPVLFQFPRSFRADRPLLEEFLALLPAGIDCAFEFRSPSWLDPGILDLLRDRGCSLCTADSDEQPAEEIITTASWGYLRLHRSEYTKADLAQWQERILACKWKRAFVFFKHEDPAGGPAMAAHFQKLASVGRKGAGRET